MPIVAQLTPDELRAALTKFDVSQNDLGRLVGYNERSAQRWVANDGVVPGPVALIVNLLLERPELQQLIGLKRHSKAGRKPRTARKVK